MSKLDLKWRVIISIVILGLGIYMMYPPLDPDNEGPKTGKINLGLDLQGGMHMVMNVRTGEAVRNELVVEKNHFNSFLKSEKIRNSTIEVLAEDTKFGLRFALDSIEDRNKVEEKIKEDTSYKISTTTDADKFILMASMPSDRVQNIKENALQQALLTIRNRIDELGVSEPIVQQQKSLTKGAMPRILVQLPGVKDIQRAKDIIGKTAQLEFQIVIDGPAPKDELLSKFGGRVPPRAELAETEGSQGGRSLYYLLERDAQITGADLDSVRVDKDQYGKWAVSFSLTRDGGKKFVQLTQANLQERLAIVLDDVVQSAPVINSRISRNGQITGDFTFDEAEELMIVLRSGALPASVVPFEERTVGPSLGHDSIDQGIKSIVYGAIFVLIFMVIWYKVSGVIADFAMLSTLILLLGALASLKATLTLPGIAGIILTIGMAVDANVLIYERIREELRQGKTIRTAVSTGYSRAFITIMDANVTTLIAAIVLLQFGMGPVRGFAVTLSIGIVASMISALFIARVIMDLILARPQTKNLSI